MAALALQRALILSYALNVLSADPSRPRRVAASSPASPYISARADDSAITVALLIGAAALLLYALAIGIGLLGGDISPASAYAWMMPVPLALAACYAWGFARDAGAARDLGLLVSALGWLACALCLLTLQGAVKTALSSGLRLDQMTPTPLSWFFAILAIAGIGAGAVLSLRRWQSETD